MRDASLRADRIALGIGFGSLALILGALGFQYIGGVAPCEMCHWQRWPHIAAAIIGLIAVPLWKKGARPLAIVAIVLVVISGMIAAYQTGMQLGILPDPQVCEVDHPFRYGSSVVPEVRCADMGWTLFGLSLAAYNALISFTTAALGIFLLGKNGRCLRGF